jgi:hypothetical protein
MTGEPGSVSGGLHAVARRWEGSWRPRGSLRRSECRRRLTLAGPNAIISEISARAPLRDGRLSWERYPDGQEQQAG